MAPTVRRLQGCEVWVWPEARYVEVRFADGTKTCGAVEQGSPERNAQYRQTAREHGYGDDCFAMCAENEQLHVLLAEAAGWEHSPVLWKMAHGIKLRKGELHWEERRVMACMKLLNGLYDADVADVCTWMAWNNIEPQRFRLQALAWLRGIK